MANLYKKIEKLEKLNANLLSENENLKEKNIEYQKQIAEIKLENEKIKKDCQYKIDIADKRAKELEKLINNVYQIYPRYEKLLNKMDDVIHNVKPMYKKIGKEINKQLK